MARVKRQPLTDAEAARYADRFERDYEPTMFTSRRIGRPPLGPDHPSPRIQVRVPRGLYDDINRRAHAEGTTISALLRRLLETYARS